MCRRIEAVRRLAFGDGARCLGEALPPLITPLSVETRFSLLQSWIGPVDS